MVKKNSNILSVAHNYTEEEIKSIKENLKRTFDVDGIPVELTLGNLFKKTSISKFNFIIGEQFVFFAAFSNKEFGIKNGWHILEVTYQRLDLVFFKILTSNNSTKEHYAVKDSYFVENLIPTNFDISRFGIPEKNLPLLKFDKTKNNPYNINIITPQKTYTI